MSPKTDYSRWTKKQLLKELWKHLMKNAEDTYKIYEDYDKDELIYELVS